MQYSTLAALQVANKAYHPETTELHGRVRVAVIDTVLEKADKEILLAKFPAGRIRILSLSTVGSSAGGATTLKVGHNGYKDEVYNEVAKDDDAFLVATELTEVQKGACFIAPGLSGMLITSVDGFDIIATASANLAAGDGLTGAIYYVVD